MSLRRHRASLQGWRGWSGGHDLCLLNSPYGTVAEDGVLFWTKPRGKVRLRHLLLGEIVYANWVLKGGDFQLRKRCFLDDWNVHKGILKHELDHHALSKTFSLLNAYTGSWFRNLTTEMYVYICSYYGFPYIVT